MSMPHHQHHHTHQQQHLQQHQAPLPDLAQAFDPSLQQQPLKAGRRPLLPSQPGAVLLCCLRRCYLTVLDAACQPLYCVVSLTYGVT